MTGHVDSSQMQAAFDDVLDQALVFHAFADYMPVPSDLSGMSGTRRRCPAPTPARTGARTMIVWIPHLI
jgi:hypothetical protein